jgi:predicted DNA-binding transcriptional regulator YafY
MPKRPAAQETLALSLELLRRIPRRGGVTATQLREQLQHAGFEREPRTLQRLLKTLCECCDIECDASSKPYRYRWKENAKSLSMPGLSAQDALLLTLAEQQLRSLLPVRLMKSMNGFFSQARNQMDDKETPQREREWLDKVRVVGTSQPLLPPKINPEVFEQVSHALYGNQWLEVDYQNAEGARKTAKVMPLGLAQQGPRMYLVCRFDGYDNERSLALHRFISAKASTLTFERPKDFNLKQFDDNGRFGYGNGTKIRLSFQIEKSAGLHIVECPLSLDQKVVELDEAYQITATVVDSEMLDWWLLGFGDAISKIVKIKSTANQTGENKK